MKAGEFIARSTYCIFARAEKKPCSNCGWKHQCKCYYVPLLCQTGADISAGCLWQSKAIFYWLGSVMWPTACTNLNYQVNCCVKSFLHPLVTLRCDKHSRNVLGAFRPHLHLPPSTREPAVSELPGIPVFCWFECAEVCGLSYLTEPSPPHSLAHCPPLCATLVISAAHDTGFPIVVPESDNSFCASRWDDLCGKDVTKIRLERH